MLWHELATKDGCTIAEARSRYSRREFMQWAAFEKVRGIRTPRELFDAFFANLCACVVAPHMKKGKRIKIEDFMILEGDKKRRKKARRRPTKPISREAIDKFLGSWLPMQAAIGNLKTDSK